MRPTLLLSLVLAITPVLAQAPSQAGASVPCAVRIRPRAAADYDPSTEVVLRGTVASLQAAGLRLQLTAGTVRVDLGNAGLLDSLAPGMAIEVVASKRQDDAGQRLVARELRTPNGTLVLRDAQGVPVAS